MTWSGRKPLQFWAYFLMVIGMHSECEPSYFVDLCQRSMGAISGYAFECSNTLLNHSPVSVTSRCGIDFSRSIIPSCHDVAAVVWCKVHLARTQTIQNHVIIQSNIDSWGHSVVTNIHDRKMSHINHLQSQWEPIEQDRILFITDCAIYHSRRSLYTVVIVWLLSRIQHWCYQKWWSR